MTASRVQSIRRPLSALFALFYLLLAAGGEALHGASEPATSHTEAHLHAPGDSGHDCPAPPHDETHCPACKLTSLRSFCTPAHPGDLAIRWTLVRPRPAADEAAPALRSHAPPNSRAPPLG